jgi:hypothetical protein
MNQPAQEGLIFGYGGIKSDDIGIAIKKIRMRLLKMASGRESYRGCRGCESRSAHFTTSAHG